MMARLEHVMARNVARLRTSRDWTQSDLASRMSAAGFAWQTNRVTQVETLRRPLSLIETVGLCLTFGVAVDSLLTGSDEVDLKSRSLPMEDVRRALSGDGA